MTQLLHYIITYTQLPETSIKNTVELLNEACTIPFIARYRKERTGNLSYRQYHKFSKHFLQDTRKKIQSYFINQ